MATREDLYRKFGPRMLEAIIRLIFSEINLIRVKLSLPERTIQQGLDALDDQMTNTSKYDWMDKNGTKT